MHDMLQNVKKPSGLFGGPKPSKCNPNPATCVADSEALLCKVSLRYLPPVRPKGARGKQRSHSEKDATGGLFRQLMHGMFISSEVAQ